MKARSIYDNPQWTNFTIRRIVKDKSIQYQLIVSKDTEGSMSTVSEEDSVFDFCDDKGVSSLFEKAIKVANKLDKNTIKEFERIVKYKGKLIYK